MVFKRSLKADIKNFLTRFCLIVVFFTTVSILVFHVAFAATNISIPVEIIWQDDGTTTRPNVVLELRQSGNNTVLQSITLDSSNADPNNANRWVGFFTNISADVGDDFDVSYAQTLTGYQTTGTGQTTVGNAPGGNAVNSFGGIPKNGNIYLDAVYDYVFVKLENDGYHLWTYNDYSSSYASIVSSICGYLGLSIDQSTVNYFHGTNVTANHINVRRDQGGRTYVRLNGGETAEAVYGGNLTSISAPIVSFTNTQASATHTLTVHHVNEDNTTLYADTIITYNDGDTYTAEPIAGGNYEPELQGGSATGTITSDLELTYIYHPLYYFSPTIAVEVTNPQEYFRITETVDFSVTIANTTEYPLTDVHIAELLPGAVFVAGADYTLTNDQEAVIASLLVGASVTLTAQFTITDDITQSVLNEFQITAATASAYHYLDPGQTHIANASFSVRSWEDDPPLTGISNSNAITYITLMSMSLVAVVIMVAFRISR